MTASMAVTKAGTPDSIVNRIIDQPGFSGLIFSLNLIDKMTIFTGMQYVPFPEYCHFVMTEKAADFISLYKSLFILS